ncbi:MAG: 5-oxopent-3-ene-1,2,5-tricarboxylate decarboxylase, partial [Proteobacteria bacterium]|nr:5-oxopent-3-ene-1,2,5-tricarboxylate decarboxylase [Burkholderiales bacterium]
MKLVTFSDMAGTRVGVLDDGWKWVTDLSVAAPALPREMIAFIAAGPAALEIAGQAAR